MKLEEITKSKISKALKSELYRLRLRAVQLHEKYKNIEKKESLVNIDWDGFYKNYKLLAKELDKRNLKFPYRDIDKVLEEENYFGIKVIEKAEGSSILVQIGKSNVLVNPIDKKQIEEHVNGVIITKSYENYNEEDYKKKVPIYAIGKSFDQITSKEKHLFIKALKIGKGQVIIKPIKITYQDKNPAIGLVINKEKTKLSILPKFSVLTKSAKDLIKKTVWICEVEKYDKDDNESISFISLIKMAKELTPKKIFIVNANQELLKNKDDINTELKKWRGRILIDNDVLEQKEIEKELSPAQQKEYDDETARIKINSEKPLAKEIHEFKAAKWTHPNGHPRCLICGDEEPVGEICNMTNNWYGKHEFDDEEAWKKERKILREKGMIKKAEDMFSCTCVDCRYAMKSAVHCVNIKCPKCGGQMKRADRPGSGKPEENMNKSDIEFEFKKVGEEHVVGGIVYSANEVDSQEHFARQGEIWKALKGYMRNKGSIKIQHKGIARNIPILESYFVEETHHKGGSSDKYIIKKGDWWLSVYLGDSENLDIWNEIKEGKITGFSMAGRAQMVDEYV